MKRLIFYIFAFLFLFYVTNAIEQTVVGHVDAQGVTTMLVEESVLISAWEDEFNDGTDFTETYIKAVSGEYRLYGYGMNSGTYKVVHVKLTKDANDNLTISLNYGNAEGCYSQTCNNGLGCGEYPECPCIGGGSCSSLLHSLTGGPGHLGGFY